MKKLHRLLLTCLFTTVLSHGGHSSTPLAAGSIKNASISQKENISDYQEIHLGILPIILESPHGGSKDIPSIRPNPKIGGRDTYSLELTRLIRERMIERTGKSPEMIAMLANRNFVDVNRRAGPKAYRHKFTESLYQAHYKAIDSAIARVKRRHGSCLMVSIHSGWNYPVQVAIGVNRNSRQSLKPVHI